MQSTSAMRIGYIRGMYRFAWFAILFTPVSLSGQPPQMGNCQVFPAKNIWNVPIDKLPVHPNSGQFIAREGPSVPLHPDFGPSGTVPFVVVAADQLMVPVKFNSGQSDPGPYPMPRNPRTEGGSDNHLIVLRQGECKLYDIY